jgi:hypothetical protein
VRGNSSNPFEVITKTVGEKYISLLTNRSITKKTTSFNSDLYIGWGNADAANGARFTDLIYTSTNGTEKRVWVGNAENSTTIDDYQQGTVFKRITYYSPDDLWLDSITPDIQTENSLTVDKKIGTVIDFSAETTGDEASKFYDDITMTVWQTNGGYPEFATIDLGKEVPVTSFTLVPSIKYTGGKADPRAPTKVRFEVSTDNKAWTNIGEYDYDNGIYFYNRVIYVKQVTARYVRFTGVECTGAPSYSSTIGGPNTVKMVFAELTSISNSETNKQRQKPFSLSLHHGYPSLTDGYPLLRETKQSARIPGAGLLPLAISPPPQPGRFEHPYAPGLLHSVRNDEYGQIRKDE